MKYLKMYEEYKSSNIDYTDIFDKIESKILSKEWFVECYDTNYEIRNKEGDFMYYSDPYCIERRKGGRLRLCVGEPPKNEERNHLYFHGEQGKSFKKRLKEFRKFAKKHAVSVKTSI